MYSRLEILIDFIYKECSFLMEITKGLSADSDFGQTTDDIKTFRAICFGEQNIGEAVVQLGRITQLKKVGRNSKISFQYPSQ